MEVAKHQEASPGLPMSDSLTHGRAASGMHLWTLQQTPFSPTAQVSDGLGLGKGSQITAAG